MDVVWTYDGDLRREGDWYHSGAASARYRMLLPGKQLRTMGHEVTLLPISGQLDRRPDVLVLGKVYPATDLQNLAGGQNLRLARQAKELGAHTVADVNDDHFSRPDVGPYWRELVVTVDACTVGSAAMARVVRQYTDKPLHIIGDPLGSPAGAASVWRRKWLTKPRLELVWYGALGNFASMEQWAHALEPLWRSQPYRIRLVTKPHAIVSRLVNLYGQKLPGALEFIEWSEAAQWGAVADAHVVLIPSESTDPKKAVKTSNRLTDAINAGRYVIASPLEAYRPYDDCCALTEEPRAALEAYLAKPDVALEKVRRGQEVVRQAHGLEAIAGQWLEAFRP